jgi:hypothetical protein
MGEPQLMNNQNKVFQPIFYKKTTFVNYEKAMHVLSVNNCVIMDDLFRNQSNKANCDALVAKKWMTKIVLIAMKMIYTKTSQEGLSQVYDDIYRFLLVTNFEGR